METLCAHTGALHESSASLGNEGPSEQAWADAFAQALLALQKYSRAQRGDRTMLDALIPAQQAFSDAAHSGLSSLHLTCHESMHEEQRTREHHTAGLSEKLSISFSEGCHAQQTCSSLSHHAAVDIMRWHSGLSVPSPVQASGSDNALHLERRVRAQPKSCAMYNL